MQVKLVAQKKIPFDIQKRKQAFLDVRPKFVDPEQPSTLAEVEEMPERFQQIFRKQAPRKVSKLKPVLSSCLALLHDKDVIAELQALIEETPVESQPERTVKHVKKKFKTGHELRLTVQIGHYDMDYIILDLGLDVHFMTRKTWKSMGKSHLD